MRRDKGVILLMTVFAIGLGSLMVSGVLYLITSDLSINGNVAGHESARWAAEAGIETAIAQLKQESTWSAGLSNISFATNGSYTVTVSNTYPSVTLTSTGKAQGSLFTRSITAVVSVVGPPLLTPYRVRVDQWTEY